MKRHHVKHATNQMVLYLQVLAFAMPVLLGALPAVYAADLTSRTIRIGSATPGQATTHQFAFTVPTTATVGSIVFDYCGNSPLTSDVCIPPVGLNTASASLQSQAGTTGFTINAGQSTDSRIVVSRVPAAGTTGTATYTFANIINPTNSGDTAFVRISTHAAGDGSGPANDSGSVAFAVVNRFEVSAFVPPYLTFCVGVFVTLNCNSATGTLIDVGELQTNAPATGSLQFSGATNDATGYTTFLTGFTMTSGNNIVNPLETNAQSNPGSSQFGLNVRSNNNPSIGLDPAGPGSTAPAGGYNIPNSFRFVSGEAIASSPTSTDFKIFTASYIVNVPDDQPPGVYATTMTFTAVASF